MGGSTLIASLFLAVGSAWRGLRSPFSLYFALRGVFRFSGDEMGLSYGLTYRVGQIQARRLNEECIRSLPF